MILIPFLAALFGAFSRLLVPWLIKRIKAPNAPDSAFSWRYFWPQLASFVVVVLLAPMLADIESIAQLAPAAAYLAGWGIADMGQTLILDGAIGIRKMK